MDWYFDWSLLLNKCIYLMWCCHLNSIMTGLSAKQTVKWSIYRYLVWYLSCQNGFLGFHSNGVQKWKKCAIFINTTSIEYCNTQILGIHDLTQNHPSEILDFYREWLLMSKWQTMQISGETARYALSHLNLHCLQKAWNALGSEIVKGSLWHSLELFKPSSETA